jgi:hypothetical protein
MENRKDPTPKVHLLTASRPSVSSLDSASKETYDPNNQPLIIEATLPILFRNCRGHRKLQSLISESAPDWTKCLKAIGVLKVKEPTEVVWPKASPINLDRAIFGDYKELFKNEINKNHSEVIFTNAYGCATASAVAWLEMGGRGLVASFGGVGSLPALEEILIALKVSYNSLPSTPYSLGDLRACSSAHSWLKGDDKFKLSVENNELKRLKELYLYMSNEIIPLFKPVTGAGIFAVESGVHVDGLIKEASLYEPFPPQMVGARRYLCLGVHSGKKSLKLKCDCLGLKVSENQLTELLSQVKELSVLLERSLTDQDLRSLYLTLKDDRPKWPKITTEDIAPVLSLRQSLANC